MLGKSAGKTTLVKGKGKGADKKEPLKTSTTIAPMAKAADTTKSSAEWQKDGHLLPRTRISAEKFKGTVNRWKGKFGWITASEEIAHEKASLRGGRLFVGVDDIIGKSTLDEGAEVEFHIFEDESGLGAEEIVQTGEGKPGKGKSKGKGKKGWGKSGGKGWGTGVLSILGALLGGKGKGFGKGKGKGKGKKKEGHLLPRTRVSAEKFSGTVQAWKGKYGWITPSEPIEHEKAGKHGGNLFVGMSDIEGGLTELTPEAVVQFHIAEDASGLCAEEVVQL